MRFNNQSYKRHIRAKSITEGHSRVFTRGPDHSAQRQHLGKTSLCLQVHCTVSNPWVSSLSRKRFLRTTILTYPPIICRFLSNYELCAASCDKTTFLAYQSVVLYILLTKSILPTCHLHDQGDILVFGLFVMEPQLNIFYLWQAFIPKVTIIFLFYIEVVLSSSCLNSNILRK